LSSVLIERFDDLAETLPSSIIS